MNRVKGILVGLFVTLLVAGCSSVQRTPEESAADEVARLAMEWGTALVEQDFERALTYTTPEFQKGPRAERYRGEFGGSVYWQSIEFKSVKCDDEVDARRCEARFIIMLLRPPAVSTPIPIPYDTVWIRPTDRWYLYHD